MGLMNKMFKFFFIVGVAVIGFLLIYPAIIHQETMTDIIFFGVGKADSILIKHQGETILIDAGHRSQEKQLADKLRALGVRKIDHMILTHPDKDHIGGVTYLIENFSIKNIMRSSYEKGNKDEARIKNALKTTPVDLMILDQDYSFNLGDMSVKLFVVDPLSSNKSNDQSINILIENDEMNYFFGGDSEFTLLGDLMNQDLPVIDLYKVAHHGRLNENSEVFIEKIQPKHSVITNSPAESEVLSLLNGAGSKIYFAFDEDVSFVSDGKTIRVKGGYDGR